MTTINDIIEATKCFFDLHWPKQSSNITPAPEWSIPWNLIGSTPNNDKPGCYVLLENNLAKYVGSATVIGKRIWEYTQWEKTKKTSVEGRYYRMKPPYEYITAITTIGFPQDYSYLAVSLEAFLLLKFKGKGLINIK